MGLLTALAISLGLNGFFFVVAAVLRTDVFTDITYSLTFILLTAYLFFTKSSHSPVQLMTAAAVVLWGLRLGTYLFNRILHIKVDHRFDDKRDNPIRFGMFWLLQAVTVWVVMLPVYGILSSSRMMNLPVWYILPGAVIFIVGLVIEAVADAQKYRFKMDAGSKGSFMSSGIWKYSRHPNYFGEILVWWALAWPGVFLFQGLEFLFFLGPVYITLLLLLVSGIPLLEKSADEKWGNEPLYQKYKRTTSILVPLPVKKEK